MDASSKSDVDFDSYWEEEARNPNRNRIRIGRQYQAQVTPLLKPGESDGRRLEDLETLSWNPENSLSSFQLTQYFSIAKAIGLFVQAVDTCHEGLEDDGEEEGDEQEERPFEILQIGPSSSCEESNSIFNTGLPVTAHEKQSITTRQQRLLQQREQQTSVDSEPGSSSPLKHTSNTRIQSALKGLSAFISSHHSPHKEKRCKFTNARENAEQPPISLGSSENYNLKTLSELLMGEWTANEAQTFARALQVCGKNFSAIKKDYLPWKSVRSIIEFYYYSVDKEGEPQHRKKCHKSPTKHLDKPHKSPLDEGKRKRNSRDSGSDSSSSSSSSASKANEKVKDVVEEANGNGNGDNDAGALSDPQTDTAKHCTTPEGALKGEASLQPSNVLSLVTTGNATPKNGLPGNEVAACKALNGNHVLGSDQKRTGVPGQEVRPLKAKPILQGEALPAGDGGDNNLALNSNSSLGSLNLYLHGELVLKLNAQQQETGQKWVESMEVPPKKKRHLTSNNGLSNSSRLSGPKRNIDTKVGQLLLKEDLDDMSTCGGDVSGSDDDSITSNESSSLVASSPSSSSTINSAAKKARVKVENLSSSASNGPSLSPPNSSRKSDPSSGKQRTVSPSPAVDTEVELQKKLLEASLGMFRLESGHGMLFGGGLFEPPKAHSNAPAAQFPAHHPLHLTTGSPAKQSLTVKAEGGAVNGHTNGFSATGPVDLTRKAANGHCSSERYSPSRRNSPSMSNSNSKTAHESPSRASLSPGRPVPNSLFSLPAPPPPPPNVPVSPNGHSKHLKKPLIRTGGVQFAK